MWFCVIETTFLSETLILITRSLETVITLLNKKLRSESLKIFSLIYFFDRRFHLIFVMCFLSYPWNNYLKESYVCLFFSTNLLIQYFFSREWNMGTTKKKLQAEIVESIRKLQLYRIPWTHIASLHIRARSEHKGLRGYDNRNNVAQKQRLRMT